MSFLYRIHSHPISPTAIPGTKTTCTLSVPMRHYPFISLPPSSRNAPPCSQNLTAFHAATELEITWFGANKATSGKKHSRELAAAPKGSCCGAIGMTICAKKKSQTTNRHQSYSWLRSRRCEEMGDEEERRAQLRQQKHAKKAVHLPLVCGRPFCSIVSL